MYFQFPNVLAFNRKLILKSFIKRDFNTRSNELFFKPNLFFSKSEDIFQNLSLEDWIYRNVSLKKKTIVLLWRNRPSVVIGRHQNPWVECNLRDCMAEDVCVVRRNSGGGTVYQDLNNLNISFISDKTLYNRLNNLILIQNVLKAFNIDSQINKREDLVLTGSGHKISGTASKVGADNSYHHLTLLIDSDPKLMNRFIRKQSTIISSKATESIRSVTANLKSVNNGIRLEDVVKEIGLHFNELHKMDSNKTYSEVIPNESNFPGITEIENSFRSWEWIYGKTPRFTVNKEFCWEGIPFSLQLKVFHGLIETLSLTKFNTNLNLKGFLFNRQYISNEINEILSQIKYNYNFELFLINCILNCVEETLR